MRSTTSSIPLAGARFCNWVKLPFGSSNSICSNSVSFFLCVYLFHPSLEAFGVFLSACSQNLCSTLYPFPFPSRNATICSQLSLKSVAVAETKFSVSDSMRSSFRLPHDVCRTPSCTGISQHGHLDVISANFATSHLQQFSSGFEKFDPSRRRRDSRGECSTTGSRQYVRFRRASIGRNLSAFHSRTQLLSRNVGIADRGCHRRRGVRTTSSTQEREWQEYEEAVQETDLGRTLEALDVLNNFESDSEILPEAEVVEPKLSPTSLDDANMSKTAIGQFDRPQTFDDLMILDACKAIADLAQVGQTYDWLESKGNLPNFGKFKDTASEGERLVTEAVLMDSIGLKASKLSPKKWGLSGDSAIALPVGIALYSSIVDSGVDLRPVAALVLALGFYDAIYLGGTGLMQIFSMWLPYRRRVLVHEAGHVLVAYLLGCPIRGVILDPMEAMKMGIQGQVPDKILKSQAGTQFWDKTLEMDLSQGRLSGMTVDRYSIVLFAGIAAEALIYGQAHGGESDENLFKSVVSQLQPAWSPAKMSNQARWAVLQAFKLLKENKKAHSAVVEALKEEAGLGSLIRAMEKAMA